MKGLWDLFEKPQTSFAAKCVSIFSVTLVLISTMGMCINTFTWMQIKDINGDPVDNPKLALVEAVCISYLISSIYKVFFKISNSPPLFHQKAEPHRFYQLRWPLRI